MDKIEIPIIKLHQSVWDMYVGVMSALDLYSIAEVDRIRLESLKIPKYAGFQRALVQDRVNSIRDYLRTPECTFPNSIILTIDSDYIEEWEDLQKLDNISSLKIRKEKGAVKIIDGQHRAAALDASDSDFQVIVTIFVDLEIVKCAQIFAKINSTQKAVNPSIAFQLFGYAEKRSPRKTAHEIAEVLNNTKGSPFYKKLKMLGTKDDWAKGTLSQSTFCKHLMRLYSKDPEKDENLLLRNEILEDYPGYPVRAFFRQGNDDRILGIVWKYFYNVAKTWENQWDDGTGRSILTKTTGYASFIEVLKQWLLSERAKQVLEDKGVKEAFNKIKDKYVEQDKNFVRENYPAGNQGVVKLRDSLLGDLGLQ